MCLSLIFGFFRSAPEVLLSDSLIARLDANKIIETDSYILRKSSSLSQSSSLSKSSSISQSSSLSQTSSISQSVCHCNCRSISPARRSNHRSKDRISNDRSSKDRNFNHHSNDRRFKDRSSNDRRSNHHSNDFQIPSNWSQKMVNGIWRSLRKIGRVTRSGKQCRDPNSKYYKGR